MSTISFWQQQMYFEGIDFLVIGAGIVGISSALELKKKYPDAKILIAEKGVIPGGASYKNAGFACFGSPTELMDDLEKQDTDIVWRTVALRWEGLQRLKELIGVTNMGLEQTGSYDIILDHQLYQLTDIQDVLANYNQEMFKITGHSGVFSTVENWQSFGFQGVKAALYNKLEGQLNTAKLMDAFYRKAVASGIYFLFGCDIVQFQSERYGVYVHSNLGFMRPAKVLVCTNGFASQLLPGWDVSPARAQVLMTQPMDSLPFKGTFHADRGYYYFRNVGNRILLGGGRQHHMLEETTSEELATKNVQDHLTDFLHRHILPRHTVSVEYRWAGIMGVGGKKEPIICKMNEHVGVGVRMGGMGVSIGSLVGKQLADLF
jgi:gamma-glutamylputrescine oxidase